MDTRKCVEISCLWAKWECKAGPVADKLLHMCSGLDNAEANAECIPLFLCTHQTTLIEPP